MEASGLEIVFNSTSESSHAYGGSGRACARGYAECLGHSKENDGGK